MAASTPVRLDRRSFLTGRRGAPALRPPWSDEASVSAHCTGCGDCIRACPEGILAIDAAKRPAVALNGGTCTFCGACADACPEPVFDQDEASPWRVTARIGDACLLTLGIDCRLCGDACDAEAIRFDPASRPMGAVGVDAHRCTGCGSCLGVCPAEAIALVQPDGAEVRA